MKRFAEKLNLKRIVTFVMAFALVVGTVPANLAPTVHAAGSKTILFDVQDQNGNSINDATIKLWCTEYDEVNGDEQESPVSRNEDGSFSWSESYGCDCEYNYTVSKEGYEEANGEFEFASTDSDTKTIQVTLKGGASAETPEQTQARLAALAKKLEGESNMKPSSLTDKNINEYVLNKLKGYTGLDASGVKVSLKSSDEPDWIATDGTIKYKNSYTLGSNESKFKYVNCEFVLTCGDVSVETEKAKFTIGWDIEYVNSQLEAERDALSFDSFKNENTSINDITSDLAFPEYANGTATNSWSKVTWKSSNENVIKIDGYDDSYTHITGKVIKPDVDTEVTITASLAVPTDWSGEFGANSGKEFKTYTKDFKVTVKGKNSIVTAESLRELLHTYYLTDNDKAKSLGKKPYENLGFSNSSKEFDPNNVDDDISLPRYRNIEDENGNGVFDFSKKELTVSYEGSDGLLTVNSTVNPTKITVDRLVSDKDIKAKFKVLLTRGGITVSEEVEITVKPATEELDAELELMEFAKANYWNAINDNRFESKDQVTSDLHRFYEITKDENGKLKVTYAQNDVTRKGIVPDDYFTPDSHDAEGAGYYNFKTSNRNVVSGDMMQVTKPEYTTEVTISSLLSSAKFKDSAAKHPNNEKLKKLVKQEVSVTIKVIGEKGDGPVVTKHDDIDVFLTVSNKGVIAKANDGSLMTQRKVTATDINEDGVITYDEALVAAHKTYYTADGYACSGTMVTKLWGENTSNTLFYRNNKGIPSGVGTDTVENGDYLTASVIKDGDLYSDWYVYFKLDGEIGLNKEITLTLLGHLGMGYTEEDTTDKPIPGLIVKTVDGRYLGTTDANGQIKIKLDSLGSLILTAEGTSPYATNAMGLMESARTDDDKVAYGKTNWSTYECYIGYTEKDYGDGPYPYDEIKWADLTDYEWEDYHFLTSNKVTGCPIIAPTFTINVTEDGGNATEVKPYTPAEDEKAVVVSDERLAEIFANTASNLTNTATVAAGAGNIYGAEWTVMGLARNGEVNEDLSKKYYASVESYVKQNIKDRERINASAATENARVILALTALGYDPTNVAGHNLLAGLDSISYVKGQGINGAIWALIAVDSGNYEIPANANTADATTREVLVKTILNAQLADGGFALTGSIADPDITAMAIQALAPYKGQADVAAAIDKAVNVLSKMQNANGGYKTSYAGDSAETIAQVIVALTSVGIDPKTDARFVKDGISLLDSLARFATANGGFKHVSAGIADGMATEQSFYALVAYNRFKEGKNSLYNMSDVTKKENPIVENTEPVQLEVPKINDALTDVSIAEDKIDEAIAAGVVPEKQLVKIDMSNSDGSMATVAPVAVLEEVRGKNIDVVLNMGDYSWTINGNDITAENLQAINLEVKEVKDKVPAGVVASLVGDDETAIQLELTHNGDFGFKATLKYFFGKENEGKYVNIFWYKEDGTTEFIDSGLIGADGFAELTFTHASEYVAVISNVDKKEAVLDTEINNNEPVKSAQTGDTFAGSIVVSSMILCMLIGMAAVMYIRRKEER